VNIELRCSATGCATIAEEAYEGVFRLILIKDDEGRAENVRPLAQREIAKFDLQDPNCARELMSQFASAAQNALRQLVKSFSSANDKKRRSKTPLPPVFLTHTLTLFCLRRILFLCR